MFFTKPLSSRSWEEGSGCDVYFCNFQNPIKLKKKKGAGMGQVHRDPSESLKETREPQFRDPSLPWEPLEASYKGKAYEEFDYYVLYASNLFKGLGGRGMVGIFVF